MSRTLLAVSLALTILAPRVQVTPNARAAPDSPADTAEASTEPLRFVFLGDYGTTDPPSFEVASVVRALAPRFIVTLGDNNYPSGSAATIDANIGQHYHEFIEPYTGAYGAGASFNRFWPCLGNHDWNASGAQPYLDYFELPGNERYYDFVRGPVHFFALDSDAHEPDGNTRDSDQARWLEPRLRAATEPFKMVYMHHAPYDSSSNHGSIGTSQWPFKEWGATIVLAGHDHLYERLGVGGLTYVVDGLGGRNTYTFDPAIGGSQLRFNAEHGALLVAADSELAHFQFVTSSGVVADDFVLPPGGLDPGVVPFVPEDADWRYLDTGVEPGPEWRTLGYDDSGWSHGRAQLGYGEGDEATVVSYGGDTSHRFITTWFRRAFSVADPDALERLQLRLLVDDGAVVYVNGREVARTGMPAGAITAATLASTTVSGEQENVFLPYDFGPEALLDVRPGALARGRNVLAVEVHQASRTSNDVSFAAELVGIRKGRMLLPRASLWRYLDDGVAPAADWKEASFDDSHWSVGRAQLGYGEGDELTQLASGSTTTWFRAEFALDELASVRWLSCRLLRDDGAIVYLNGREAARFDLPRSGVTPATLAPFNVGHDMEGRFEETSLDPRLLVEGVNTIAVEMHQSNNANPDLSFDLELVAH